MSQGFIQFQINPDLDPESRFRFFSNCSKPIPNIFIHLSQLSPEQITLTPEQVACCDVIDATGQYAFPAGIDVVSGWPSIGAFADAGGANAALSGANSVVCFVWRRQFKSAFRL